MRDAEDRSEAEDGREANQDVHEPHDVLQSDDIVEVDDETIQHQPAAQALGFPLRILIAVVVVLGSAAVGYMASRMWPLTAFSSPRPQVAFAGNAKVVEPRMSLPAVTVQADFVQAIGKSSIVALNAGAAAQSVEDHKSVSDTEIRAADPERDEPAPVGNEKANKKKPPRAVQGQRNSEAAPQFAKSANAGANYRQNPALNAFMSSPNTY
jgi:hypothetical protein